MDNVIRETEKTAFGNDEITKLCEGKVKIVKYSDIKKYSNLDTLLKPWDSVILLYETQPNFGHWTALMRYQEEGKNIIEFFDPYGIPLDKQLNFVPANMKSKLNEDHKYLTELMLKYKQQHPNTLMKENIVQLQDFKNGVNTCGRWSGMRVCFKHIPLTKFIACFKNQKEKPDFYITLMTSFIEKKRDRDYYGKETQGEGMVSRDLRHPCPSCER